MSSNICKTLIIGLISSVAAALSSLSAQFLDNRIPEFQLNATRTLGPMIMTFLYYLITQNVMELFTWRKALFLPLFCSVLCAIFTNIGMYGAVVYILIGTGQKWAECYFHMQV